MSSLNIMGRRLCRRKAPSFRLKLRNLQLYVQDDGNWLILTFWEVFFDSWSKCSVISIMMADLGTKFQHLLHKCKLCKSHHAVWSFLSSSALKKHENKESRSKLATYWFGRLCLVLQRTVFFKYDFYLKIYENYFFCIFIEQH